MAMTGVLNQHHLVQGKVYPKYQPGAILIHHPAPPAPSRKYSANCVQKLPEVIFSSRFGEAQCHRGVSRELNIGMENHKCYMVNDL